MFSKVNPQPYLFIPEIIVLLLLAVHLSRDSHINKSHSSVHSTRSFLTLSLYLSIHFISPIYWSIDHFNQKITVKGNEQNLSVTYSFCFPSFFLDWKEFKWLREYLKWNEAISISWSLFMLENISYKTCYISVSICNTEICMFLISHTINEWMNKFLAKDFFFW